MNVDVLFISETHHHDHTIMALLKRELKAKWVAVNAPRDHSDPENPRPLATGGVGFLVLNRKVKITPLLSDSHGGQCIVISLPGYMPICLIGVYNPPSGSVLNRDGRNFSAPILSFIRDTYMDVRRSYDTVLILGDLNMRLGTLPGLHYTRDAIDPTVPARRTEMIALCEALRVLPVHGRPEAPHFPEKGEPWRSATDPTGKLGTGVTYADATSHAVGDASKRFTAEVDYILADACTPTSVVRPLRATAVNFMQPSSHLGVSVAVMLAPDKGPSTVPDTGERPKRLHLPEYTDERAWNAIAAGLPEAMSGAVATRDSNLMHERIVSALRKQAARQPRHQTGGKRVGRHAPPRKCGGRVLSPHVENLFNVARDVRSQCLPHIARYKAAARRVGAGAGAGAGAGSTESAHSELKELETLAGKAKKQLADANKAARSAASAEIRRRVRDALNNLERMRVHDPSRLHKILRDLAPGDPQSYSGQAHIPGSPGRPAVQRFSAAFADLAKETREGVPGTTSARAEWDAFIPRAQHADEYAAVIDGPITAAEVYMCCFPLEKQMETMLPLHGPLCSCCAELKASFTAWDPDDPDSEPPSVAGRLQGGKSAGSAGIPAELISFPRPPAGEGVNRFEWRMGICNSYATFFEHCRSTGVVPTNEGFADSVVTPLIKKSTPGHTVDPSDPDDYRGIAAGNTLSKLFGLVLLRRLTHWCIGTGVIPPNQAGFMLHHSAEHQVFTLLETLKHRSRCGQDTHLLFLDLKKAYDSVHLGALWHILGRMGVPTSLITLLQHWSSKRTARVMVNGVLSDPYPCTKGLPQGDVLSPLLFNLYISVLMNKLRQLQGYHGAQWDGLPAGMRLAIRDLWYADDMVALFQTGAELQLVLDAVGEWSAAWGIDVGLGQGKTNVMFIPASLDADAAVPPTTFTLKGRPVEWVKKYRYLGFDLTPSLTADDFCASMVRRIRYHSNRLFTFNRAVQSLSIALQLQLMMSNVLGCVNYLMAVVQITPVNYVAIDGAITGVLRTIMGLSDAVCTQAVHADTGVPHARALVLAHRARFAHHLRLMPDRQAPAVKVFEALHALRNDATHSSRTRNGVVRAPWICLHQEIETVSMDIFGTPLPPGGRAPAALHELRKSTAILQRGLAYGIWRSEKYCFPKGFHVKPKAECGIPRQPPNFRMPREHLQWLYAIGYYDVTPTRLLGRATLVAGTLPHASPVSAWGPGCSGTPIALSTRLYSSQVGMIMWSRTGAHAMRQWPFHHRDSGLPPTADQTSGKKPGAGRSNDDGEKIDVPDCTHCGRPERQTIWHLANECQQAHIRQYREEVLQPDAAALMLQIVKLLKRGHTTRREPQQAPQAAAPNVVAGNVHGGPGPHQALAHKVPTRPLSAAFVAASGALVSCLAQQANPGWWSRPDAQHLVYRLVVCAPFSAFDVRPVHPSTLPAPGDSRTHSTNRSTTDDEVFVAPTADTAMPCSLALGGVFDATILPNSRLRPWANAWTQWSVKHILGLAGVHRCGSSGVRDSTNRVVPCPLCPPPKHPSPVLEAPMPDITGGPVHATHQQPHAAGGNGAGAGAGAGAAAAAAALALGNASHSHM